MPPTLIASVMTLFLVAYSADGSAMRPMDFFEKYDLKEIAYIGPHTVECRASELIVARILDPEHLPHYVRVGTYVGKDSGVITRITDDHLEISEVVQDASGQWVERRVTIPRVEGGVRARFRYEEDQALTMLGKINKSGNALKEKLIDCRRLFGHDEKRLKCFDDAVGTLF